MNNEYISADKLKSVVEDICNNTQALDIHTHIYDAGFGDLLLWGVDELLVYHYMVAEYNRFKPIGYDNIWAMSKKELAEKIWETLFIEHSPISESARGVLTCLSSLGIDVSSRDLNEIRKYFAATNVDEYIDTVFKTAKIRGCIMTNDPFDPQEVPCWDNHKEDPRFGAALRIDYLLNNWPMACKKLQEWGYKVDAGLDAKTCDEVKRFLADWVKKINPKYMAASLPPTFKIPEPSDRSRLVTECILPIGREYNLPFGLMIGVKKLTNPGLKLAGDSVGFSGIETVEYLCRNYPDNKFLLTMLAREDQHACCVAARKFPNLHVFGCWWFLNNPVFINEMVRMRIEMLGMSVTPQHSDARVIDQLIYKWVHYRKILAEVLTEKYADVMETGWKVTREEIQRDVNSLLGGSFEEFLAR